MGNEINQSLNVKLLSDTILSVSHLGAVANFIVSGEIELGDRSSLVRILLIDNHKKAYLIYEDYYKTDADISNIISIDGIGIETAALDSVKPSQIKVIVRNATCRIRSFEYVPWKQLSIPRKNILSRKDSTCNSYEAYMIDKWNTINQKEGNLWFAGHTQFSAMSYEERKDAMGITTDDYISDGFEYYRAGIFVFKDKDNNSIVEQQSTNENSPYVEAFDWRNRHGKNWLTSVKNQLLPIADNSIGNGGCWAFATCATVESGINLYYNQLLDYDLSEQELGSCCPYCGTIFIKKEDETKGGGSTYSALNYVKNNGIGLESYMPFQNNCDIPCSDKQDGSPIVQIDSYVSINRSEDALKSAIINYGPIVSSMDNGYYGHAMCLCGYFTIHLGDTIWYCKDSVRFSYHIVPPDSEYLNKTCWIYKNSSGTEEYNDGYLYCLYEEEDIRTSSYALTGNISVSSMFPTDVKCEDADNDGYYSWGLGKKPRLTPMCCPDTPDGDDSNPSLAQMDKYGNFAPYVFPYDTLYVTENTQWNSNFEECGNIVLSNGANVNLSAVLILNPAAKIIVRDGATLTIDGGTIINSTIEVENAGHLILANNGRLIQNKKDSLNIHLGGIFDLLNGEIVLPK